MGKVKMHGPGVHFPRVNKQKAQTPFISEIEFAFISEIEFAFIIKTKQLTTHEKNMGAENLLTLVEKLFDKLEQAHDARHTSRREWLECLSQYKQNFQDILKGASRKLGELDIPEPDLECLSQYKQNFQDILKSASRKVNRLDIPEPDDEP